MQYDDSKRRSHWTMRVMEWDEPRARYPNLWSEGMPAHVLAFERIGARLRLGDLIAVYHPASAKHPERSNRFVGLARVIGVRRADDPQHAWVDLEAAHRFDPPLETKRTPRRVFMCCDPGWPEHDVSLFREAFDAAVAAGWTPAEDEGGATEPAEPAPEKPAVEEPASETESAVEGDRLFAGVDYSGDMRDPRLNTWLAVVALRDDKLRVLRLDPTGRSGLQVVLRNPDRELMTAEAIGLGFPFGLPLPFAESLLGGKFPEEGWWALAKRLERVSWPEYLTALHEFRDEQGEIRRLADEQAGALSPLHRVDPDMGSRSYHGIRMIAEDRSRFAIRPFETAQGRLLIEVNPGGAVRRLGMPADSSAAILTGLQALEYLPLEIGEAFRRRCLERRDALDAVIAARCAAVAVLTDEAQKSPEELAPEQPDRVRQEGWIYGLTEPR